MSGLQIPTVVLIGAVLSACTGAGIVPDAPVQDLIEYELGAPVFDVEAIASSNDGETGCDLYVSVHLSSLVFTNVEGEFRATFDMRARVLPQGSSEPVYSESWTDTISVETYDETQGTSRLTRKERIALPPGVYHVDVTVEDESSSARSQRRRTVEIVQPGSEAPALSDVLLEATWGEGGFEPVASLHVPAAYDTLRAVVELYNLSSASEVKLSLVRFATDTSSAEPPFWFTPAPFSLTYMGIDYGDSDTIQVSRRLVLNAEEQFGIVFVLPRLEKGTYAARIEVLDGEEPAVSKSRYFSVMGPSFPRITALPDMIAALTYIARENEMERMRSAESPDEMKRLFDVFWAERVPNREAAASLLKSYYERVEEANLLFSTQKEGWKTDRGMIYILFGAPAYVEDGITRLDWYYFLPGALLNRRLPPFIFRRAMAHGQSGLYENFVLQRSEVYEEVWRRKVEDWRDGTVL